MATGIFAGIPVRDFGRALDWYRRLLGGDPSFFPHETEAVWQLAEDRFVYIVEDSGRAGGAIGMIWYDDPTAEVDRITTLDIEPVEVEEHGTVRKYVFRDADGNEIGIGGDVSAS